MKSGKVLVLSTLVMNLSIPALAQTQEETQAQTVDVEKPYEVIIRGRITKSRLRDLIIKVEDDFFQKFNELNMDDYYDISCYEYVPTMSHIKKRLCEPQFMLEAKNSNGSEVMYGFGNGGNTISSFKKQDTFLMDTRTLRAQMKPDFDKLEVKMGELLDENREFSEIGAVLTQLKSRLENDFNDD